MPARNSIKQFVPNTYYHLYNRGVEKRNIFMDNQDYAIMLSYLQTYLLPKDEDKLRQIILAETSSSKQRDETARLLRLNNFSDTMNLICYCLMPNHFHFLVKQTEAITIDRFMNSLFTRYSMYFNRRHKRIGPLFQGIYKAVLVKTDEQLLHLSRYIHRNPASKGSAFQGYLYSSYQTYLGLKKTEWLHPKDILLYFGEKHRLSYQSFVEDSEFNESTKITLHSLTID